MSKFFDPQGKEITKETFIDYYSKCYFLNNSAIVENRIEGLLEASELTPGDVMLILRWKLGRIDHKQSQRLKAIVNRGNEKGFSTVNSRGKTVNAQALCSYISDKLISLKTYSDQEILNKLVDDCQVANIGTVYLITLLFLITNGRCPIYDRFAAAAINAIINEATPGEEIQNIELPSKNYTGYRNLLTPNESLSKYQVYIKNLKSLFNDEYQKDRRIDQALWVYGHLFQIKDKTC